MRIKPSARLAKLKKTVMDDNEYLNSLETRNKYLSSFEEAINSPFGEVLIKGLENLEKAGLEKLTTSWRKTTIAQARADIATARYLLSMFRGMLAEKAVLDQEMKALGEQNESI